MWIVQNIDAGESAGIYALNPGDRSVRVGFTTFDDAGRLIVDRSFSVTANAGGIAPLTLLEPETAGRVRRFWVLVIAERPIFVDAEIGGLAGRGGATARKISAHRLDCTNPAGYEFACRAAGAVAR